MNVKRRLPLRIGFTLLTGTVCTVAAAWISALTLDPISGGKPPEIETTNTTTRSLEATRVRRLGAVMLYAIHAKGQFDERSVEFFGGGNPERIIPEWSGLLAPSREFEEAEWSHGDRAVIENRTVVARGWPLPALWSEVHSFVTQGGTLLTESRSTGGIATSQRAWRFSWNRTLPFRLVPVGFVADTLLYALLVGVLMYGRSVVRYLVRLRKGLCLRCGYPVGDSPECSECGASVRRTTA